MEKFQIAKYALMQVVALVYAMLACGAAVKFMNTTVQGLPMSNSYYAAEFVRDYGLWLFVIIFGWTLLAAYFSSGLTTWEVSPLKLTISGIIICLLLCISASIIAFLTVDGIVWGMSDSAQH